MPGPGFLPFRWLCVNFPKIVAARNAWAFMYFRNNSSRLITQSLRWHNFPNEHSREFYVCVCRLFSLFRWRCRAHKVFFPRTSLSKAKLLVCQKWKIRQISQPDTHFAWAIYNFNTRWLSFPISSREGRFGCLEAVKQKNRRNLWEINAKHKNGWPTTITSLSVTCP